MLNLQKRIMACEKKKDEFVIQSKQNIYEKISNKNSILMSDKQKNHFKDITLEFIKDVNPDVNLGIENAKSITKNGITYRVNSKNKIIWKNNEENNGKWFLNFMGGKLKRLPEIHSATGVNMADFKYYPVKGKPYFLETKEIILEEGQYKAGKNNIVHKLEENPNQANVFLIDVTGGNLTDKEILERVHVVFYSKSTRNMKKTLIIKNREELFGIFTDI